MRRRPQFTGDLGRRDPLPKVLRFQTSANWGHPVLHEHRTKVDLVFAHYELDPKKREWEKLAWNLLYDFVPGFQHFKRSPGPPRKWTPSAEAKLIADVERIRDERHVSVGQACKVLARQDDYARFGVGGNRPNWRTLQQRYAKAKKLFVAGDPPAD